MFFKEVTTAMDTEGNSSPTKFTKWKPLRKFIKDLFECDWCFVSFSSGPWAIVHNALRGAGGGLDPP